MRIGNLEYIRCLFQLTILIFVERRTVTYDRCESYDTNLIFNVITKVISLFIRFFMKCYLIMLSKDSRLLMQTSCEKNNFIKCLKRDRRKGCSIMQPYRLMAVRVHVQSSYWEEVGSSPTKPTTKLLAYVFAKTSKITRNYYFRLDTF